MSAEHEHKHKHEHKLKVVICWHMHQPEYRGPSGRDFQLPWVYLHGIKDYVDMAYHLEECPGAKAVVNFVPTLLEQIDEYARQLTRWLEAGRRIRDPLLEALAGPGIPLKLSDREALINACQRANEEHLIQRYPIFEELVELARTLKEQPELLAYLNDQFVTDLLVWYHLAWLGESVWEDDSRACALHDKGRDFNAADCRSLIAIIRDQLAGIVPRYKRLAEAGKVELSFTPYAHPIAPLLLDIDSGREAMPDAPMPEVDEYPGGEERMQWHIKRGLDAFRKHFGVQPTGCWPAEGAVSDPTIKMLEQAGISWAATGQQVLINSLNGADAGPTEHAHCHAYRLHGSEMRLYFRDDGLSDLIGFKYSKWHADDAVANLLSNLENLAAQVGDDPNAIVSIIMDGENAWEFYPRNGFYFLSALYQKLAKHESLELTTFSECLQSQARPKRELLHLVPGSWVYGTLSTWIGERDKNRAWEMLVAAKQVYDKVVASDRLSPARLKRVQLQLAVCEGSDWFWWFGDYNPGDTVSDFERLYRGQLTHLYKLLGEKPPGYLAEVFAHGKGDPSQGGVMRQVAS